MMDRFGDRSTHDADLHPTANGRFRTKRLLAIGLFLLSVVALAVVLLDSPTPAPKLPGANATRPESAPDSARTPPGQPSSTGAVAEVQTIRPIRHTISQSITLPANVSPWQQATLYAKVSGYLKWMGADKGDAVKSGTLLAVIEAPEIEDQYRQAEADYSIKKITHARLRKVWEENPDVIAKQDVDVAEAAAKGARHAMENRRTMLAYTKVSAPFSGVITARFADPGALIQAATGSATQAVPLYTLMDLKTVRIYASVPQEAALLAKQGVPAIVTARELPGQELRGTITRTTHALDPATRTLLVEIDLPNPEYRLQVGMFVTTTLILKEHPQVLGLPPAALVTSANGKSVFVVAGGRAKRVPVKTGLDDGVWIEVTDGLTEDDEVVMVGKGGLTDGQPVKAAAYNLPAGKPSSQKY